MGREAVGPVAEGTPSVAEVAQPTGGTGRVMLDAADREVVILKARPFS
jgi:hypothetical protein